jgi:predicted O-methyltransferase YrrM
MDRLEEMRKERWGEARLGGLVPLVELVKPKRVLEIGAYEGVSAEVFLLHGALVISVDPWPGHLQDVFDACLRRLALYPCWNYIRGTSPGALMELKDRAFDLVYIDGDHSEAAVRADIQAVRRLVAPGGWIGGHDYAGPDTPGVKPAVDDLLGKPTHLFSDSNYLCGPYPNGTVYPK